MITRVLDHAGNIIHDCAEMGCETSWDGYDLKTGDPVEGRADINPQAWTIDGDTARER